MDFLSPPPQPTTSFLLSLALALSSHSSSSARLKQRPHFSCFVRTTPPPSIPTSLHTSISLSASLSKDSVNQTESQRRDIYPAGGWTGYGPCSGDGLGTESPRLLEHTHRKILSKHSETIHLHLLSLLLVYLSFQFTGRLDFILNSNLPSNTLWQGETEKALERERLHNIILTVYISLNCVTNSQDNISMETRYPTLLQCSALPLSALACCFYSCNTFAEQPCNFTHQMEGARKIINLATADFTNLHKWSAFD